MCGRSSCATVHLTTGHSTSSTSTSKCWVCGKVGHRAASCWYNSQKNINNVQQQQLPPKQQQFQLQGTSDQPIAYMPPEGITTFNFQQVAQQQQLQLQYQPVRPALPSTSASSVTRVSTPGPHIYDISSINNMYSCGGAQPLGIGGHRHYFDINQLNREHLQDLPRGSLRRWAILCDTGAVTSVAPRNVADHIPLQPHYTQLSLSTATNQPIHIYGYKDVLLICNNTSTARNFSVEHQGESEPLYHHRSHLFIDAMAFDIDHRVHHHWVQYIQQYGFYGEQHILLNSDEPQHHSGEALPAQSLRSPILPSQQEQDTHSLTHQPYRSWCRVCQQAKGRGGQHRRQHQQEENVSFIQLDYTFTRHPHQAPQRQGRQTTFTILTAIESTIGLRLAVLTSKKGYTPHQAAQLHRWIIKHGFTKSVLQSDHNISDAVGEYSRH